VCGLSLQPIGCTSAVCYVQRCCGCSCRLWRYISVMPLPLVIADIYIDVHTHMAASQPTVVSNLQRKCKQHTLSVIRNFFICNQQPKTTEYGPNIWSNLRVTQHHSRLVAARLSLKHLVPRRAAISFLFIQSPLSEQNRLPRCTQMTHLRAYITTGKLAA